MQMDEQFMAFKTVPVAMTFTQNSSGEVSGVFGRMAGTCSLDSPDEIPVSCHYDEDCDPGKICEEVREIHYFSVDEDRDGVSELIQWDTAQSSLYGRYLTVKTEDFRVPADHSFTLPSIGEGVPDLEISSNPFNMEVSRSVEINGLVLSRSEISGNYTETISLPYDNTIVLTGTLLLKKR